MIELYKSTDRGVSRLDWLDSRHSFSFGGWYDPQRLGFRSLRVLNEDRIAPGAGFGAHPHRDMEILTVVLQGSLEHRDSSGARSLLRAGDVQRMSAGRGVVHSEWNASDTESLHLLQIWLQTASPGIAPSHETGRALFPVDGDAPAGLRALATRRDGEGALRIHQDALVLAGRADGEAELLHSLAPGRGAWVQSVCGGLVANGISLEAGDGLAIDGVRDVTLVGEPAGDFLLFDLA
jgi:redox-sensitive bicupin YhaK (pirin superfamily)